LKVKRAFELSFIGHIYLKESNKALNEIYKLDIMITATPQESNQKSF